MHTHNINTHNIGIIHYTRGFIFNLCICYLFHVVCNVVEQNRMKSVKYAYISCKSLQYLRNEHYTLLNFRLNNAKYITELCFKSHKPYHANRRENIKYYEYLIARPNVQNVDTCSYKLNGDCFLEISGNVTISSTNSETNSIVKY